LLRACSRPVATPCGCAPTDWRLATQAVRRRLVARCPAAVGVCGADRSSLAVPAARVARTARVCCCLHFDRANRERWSAAIFLGHLRGVGLDLVAAHLAPQNSRQGQYQGSRAPNRDWSLFFVKT
jgi:hypothetical protein